MAGGKPRWADGLARGALPDEAVACGRMAGVALTWAAVARGPAADFGIEGGFGALRIG